MLLHHGGRRRCAGWPGWEQLEDWCHKNILGTRPHLKACFHRYKYIQCVHEVEANKEQIKELYNNFVIEDENNGQSHMNKLVVNNFILWGLDVLVEETMGFKKVLQLLSCYACLVRNNWRASVLLGLYSCI